jgi:hypothetical protein
VAGGKGAIYDNDFLKLTFNGVPIPNIADNAAASPFTQFWLSLHTADPGAGGSQTTSEATYGAYARVGVARTPSGFTVSGNSVTLAANANFPAATSGSETEAFFAVGTAQTGAGKILYRGPITPTIPASTGVPPQLTTGTTITES